MKKFFVNKLKFSIFFVFLLNIFIYYFIPINTYASSGNICSDIGSAIFSSNPSIVNDMSLVSESSSSKLSTPGVISQFTLTETLNSGGIRSIGVNTYSCSNINPQLSSSMLSKSNTLMYYYDANSSVPSKKEVYEMAIIPTNLLNIKSINLNYNINSACSGVGSSYSNACMSCISKGISSSGSNSQYNHVYTDFGCINTSVKGIINFTYKLVLTIGFMIAFAVIIFSGYLIMMSGGDPEQLNRGKSLLTKAIIGLLVIVFAYAILITIGNLFNISYLQ